MRKSLVAGGCFKTKVKPGDLPVDGLLRRLPLQRMLLPRWAQLMCRSASGLDPCLFGFLPPFGVMLSGVCWIHSVSSRLLSPTVDGFEAKEIWMGQLFNNRSLLVTLHFGLLAILVQLLSCVFLTVVVLMCWGWSVSLKRFPRSGKGFSGTV